MGCAEKEGGEWKLGRRGGTPLLPRRRDRNSNQVSGRHLRPPTGLGVSPLLSLSLSLSGRFALGGVCEERPHEPWRVHVAGWQHLRRRSDARREARIWYVQMRHAPRVPHRPLVSRQETREGG